MTDLTEAEAIVLRAVAAGRVPEYGTELTRLALHQRGLLSLRSTWLKDTGHITLKGRIALERYMTGGTEP